MSLTWSANLICPADKDFDGAPLLRARVRAGRGPRAGCRATLHATAQGVFEAYLNGEPVGDDVLSPGWTSYEWRLRYRSYDVTALASARRRSLGLSRWAMAGFADGWAGAATAAYYGDELGALAQLEIVFADGHLQTVVTDDSWTAGPSAVVANDLYDGQTIDARRESDAWLAAGLLR